MPRLPHVDPADALSTFKLAAGFSIELVAAEPLVSDPVAACFDESGAMYVAEMHGYPFSHEPTRLNPKGGGKKDAGVIRRLQDTDGDGRMDSSVVFADGLSWPTSVCCYNGGVFVLAPEHLYYLKDSTGDGKADIRETVLSGFGRGNVQAVTNGLQWGLDNRIYFAAGGNPRTLLHRGKPLSLPGKSDISFDPRTETFAAVTGGLQFGHTRDDWGTRFVCSNSNHIMQVVYPEGYLSRNPFFVASNAVRSIATDGASAPVFRRSPPEPWRIVRQKWRALDKGYRLTIADDGSWQFIPIDPKKSPAGAIPTEYPVGFFTSATGITIYRGDAYPEEFHGNAFVGDVGGNLIHRKTVDRQKVVYSSSRADQGVEIIASSDNWFRPVNFVNAPDGSLYVLDMYRETIEHPYSIPEEIKAFLDLSSGDDRGRIYRLVSPQMQRRTAVDIGGLESTALVQQLASPNGWNRDTALRLIWERQDVRLVPLIEQLLATTQVPVGKVHALSALDGLHASNSSHIQACLQDSNPRVRQHAIRLSESLLKESPELLRSVAAMTTDDSEHVRFQLAFSLGAVESVVATEALTAMCQDPRNGAEVQTAIFSSVRNSAGEIARQLLFSNGADSSRIGGVLKELSIIVGSNPDTSQAVDLLQAVTQADSIPQQANVLSAVGVGLERRGRTMTQLLNGSEMPKSLNIAVDQLFDQAKTTALSEVGSHSERVLAVRLLAFAKYEFASSALAGLLSSRTPQPVQQAAVRALGAISDNAVAGTLLENWKGYGPGLRADVVETLLTYTTRTQRLLDAVEAGVVGRSDIGRVHKQLLLAHRDNKIKTLSVKLFGSDVNTNRTAVVNQYQDVLQLTGDAANGRKVFTKTCSSCHKVGNVGHNVAPELASVKNKSEADLLVAILDPNREAQPNYNTYTVITQQGRNYSGIVAAETAASITLKRAEAKQDIVLRSNIEEMVASGISLMPEGLEKDLSKQQLADVIAFVKSISQSAQ